MAIAESAEGGMRDALSFLDQAISLSDKEVTVDDVNSVTGNVSYDKIIELATCFQEKNISKYDILILIYSIMLYDFIGKRKKV